MRREPMIHKGSTRPDGIMAMVGCLRVRAVFDRNERRLVKREARTVDRRVDAGQGDVETFRALRRAVSASVASSPPEELSDEEREREYRAKVARSLGMVGAGHRATLLASRLLRASPSRPAVGGHPMASGVAFARSKPLRSAARSGARSR